MQTKILTLAAGACAALFMNSARADQSAIIGKIETMQQQIAEQQAMIDSMKAELNQSNENITGIVQQEVEKGFAQVKDSPIRVSPSSKNIKDLKIRGRVQAQAAWTQGKNDNGKEDYSTFQMRRVRLGLRGTLFNDFRAQLEANMVPGSDHSMRSAFIEWRKHKPAYIKLGYDKPRFGFEENTSSAEILTVERTLINNSLVTGPQTGLSLSGTQGIVSYAAGLYTDRDNQNAAAVPGNGDRYLANLSAGINLDDMIDGGKLRFRTDYLKSDDSAAGNFGADFDEDAMALSGHFAAGNGLDLRAEYMVGRRDNGNDISGWYITPSMFITEQLQLVGRFEMAESDAAAGLRAPSRYMRNTVAGADQRGDKYNSIYLGLNYYMAQNLHKFMFGVEHSNLKNTAAGDLKALTCYTAWRMLF